MNDTTIDELDRLANALDGETWERAGKSVRLVGSQVQTTFGTSAPNGLQGGVCNCLGVPSVKSADDRAGMRATFIAAADPHNVRAIIDRLRKAEDERDAMRPVEEAAIRWSYCGSGGRVKP